MDSDRLDHVTVADESAYSCLIAHGLPVLRVEVSKPNGNLTVTWRNEPTPEQREHANRLIIGTVPVHVF